MSAQPLCRLDDIDDGDSTALLANIKGERTSLIAVRSGGTLSLYVNSCPHILAPLDFIPGQFLTPEKDMIICSSHGALFRIEDGECVHGPCIGKHLTPISYSIKDGDIWLD